jgi:hypothetical protein
MTFATDIDLLHWEPSLFSEASSVAQTLLAGTGTLAETSFTISSGSLTDAHIEPGEVIALGASINGSFPIVSIDSATSLTLSVLFDQLFPDSGDAETEPPTPASGSDIAFSIRTFWPQRRIVSELLIQAAGLQPSDAGKILNPAALTRPCVLGTLQMIYTALAAAADSPANLLARADLYQGLYRNALRSAAVEIDFNGDGRVDALRQLNILHLHRA